MVAVCGAGACEPDVHDLAQQTGQLLARRGAILICGGLGGVMAAAAQGAKEAGGLTVGILPGPDREAANPYIDLSLATGLGHVRNAVIVRAAQAVIALPGEAGTLSEVALGLKMGRPVVGLRAWGEIKGVLPASSPAEAVDLALSQALK
ncbi:MAG: TIGR00725 family protein [Deltaproteobacteria bacterium]|nr:TIGR00725 family protein [Deltaproteobacteria bacterium]MBW2086912.1 TIGR00725 family protein [Deltaproteobacteria bacterium]